jgi:hypothetical protein
VTPRVLVGFAALGLLASLSRTATVYGADAPTPPAREVDAPPPAREVDAPPPARVLFKEARELVARGNYPAACLKFEQSLALEAGLGTQFNLADCWEHIGRTASAQALFIGAAASARAAGQTEREQVLRERAAALEPRLAHLVIEVNDSDPKLIVKRGDLPLDTEAYGKAKAVDPGSYEIVAKAPGKKTWKKTVEVASGAAITTVEVPCLEAQVSEAATLPTAARPARNSSLPVNDSPTEDHARKGPSLAVIGLGGLALGGLTVGTIMALKYRSANSDAKSVCPSSHGCTSQQISFHDQRVEDARSDRSWAFIGFGVGGLGLAAAAALLCLPQSNETERAWVPSLSVAGNGTWGANLSGKF